MAVFGTDPSAHMPRTPSLALQPLAKAVAAAAESVERESAASVVSRPSVPSFMILSAITKPSLCTTRLYCRVISMWVMPAPSARKRKIYFGAVEELASRCAARGASVIHCGAKIKSVKIKSPNRRGVFMVYLLEKKIKTGHGEMRGIKKAPYNRPETAEIQIRGCAVAQEANR